MDNDDGGGDGDDEVKHLGTVVHSTQHSLKHT
jgi:hypothetical protein